MRRREFLAGLVAAWPLAARAEQTDQMRRIGVLFGAAADDSESPARIAAFAQALAKLGWVDGRNVRLDIRWATTLVGLLRARSKRPCRRRAQYRNDLPPPHEHLVAGARVRRSPPPSHARPCREIR